MNDIEKFIELYREFGIELKPIFDGEEYEIILDCPDSETEGDKFTGYVGFYSSVIFDKNGKFTQQGFWE